MHPHAPQYKAPNSFQIVVENVRFCFNNHLQHLGVTLQKVRCQNFNRGGRAAVTYRTDCLCEMFCAAIFDVIPVNGCDHHVVQAEFLHRVGNTTRLKHVKCFRGLPVAMLQNEQARVQTSPMIIMVAWPWLQHSPTFGQPASSQTVTSLCSRIILCVSAYPLPPGAFTRIQLGFLGCALSGRCAFSGWRCSGILRSLTRVYSI